MKREGGGGWLHRYVDYWMQPGIRSLMVHFLFIWEFDGKGEIFGYWHFWLNLVAVFFISLDVFG